MQAFEPVYVPVPGAKGERAASAFQTTSPDVDGLFVRQSYDSYSEADHAFWRKCNDSLLEHWQRFACDSYLHGRETLRLAAQASWRSRADDAARLLTRSIPRLEDLNAALNSRSAFRLTGVSGRVPQYWFFERLRQSELPVCVKLRGAEASGLSRGPELFHDAAGLAPMLMDPAFTAALDAFGVCARSAAVIAGMIGDPAERRARLTSFLQAMGRLYFFTVETGLVQSGNHLRAYGASLLTSLGEMRHAVDSSRVQRAELKLEWVIHQPFAVGSFQPLLFVVESLDEVSELVRTLEGWMWEGRLDHVAPGEPEVPPVDLESYLAGCGSHQA